MPEPKHTCHARGCEVEVPPKMLMCLKHWRMVPPFLQKEIWRLYRPGQEIDKKPSYEYQVTMRETIEAVARKENV